MSELVKIISHQGHDIILLDCAGREEAEILRGFDEMLDTVIASSTPAKSLVLVDMTNTFSSMAVSKKGRDIATRGKQASLPDLPTAIVGFTGVQKTVVRAFASLRKEDTLYVANSREDALNWLISKAS